MQELDDQNEDLFSIGAVSRLTGIPVHTLRAWERRYGAVSPERQEGGGRLYRRQDISRLNLIKRLTEAGHAVSTVAQLPMEALRERARDLAPETSGKAEGGPCRVAVMGAMLPQRMRSETTAAMGLELVAVAEDRQQLGAEARSAGADMLVLELPTVHPETASQVLDLLETTGARQAVVVYAFGARPAVQALDTSRIQRLRGPVTVAEVARACGAMERQAAPADGGLVDWALDQPVRDRRYDDASLARLASLSPAMACECPNHMADLVAGLAAFERYSSECESRSPEDAALHYALHAATAQARALMEDALAYLVAEEGLEEHTGDDASPRRES
jgi:DNA-binding transcriptional MerR regulator